MVVRQRPEWTAVEIASHAMKATSLSQITLPEVKKLAARVLRERGDGLEQKAADPGSTRTAAEVSERIDTSDRR